MKCFKFLSCVLVVSVLTACGSFDLSQGSSWAWDREMSRASIRVVSVSVEKSGEWGSLEKEASDLLPLLFSEHSYLVAPSSARADYAADLKLREREYTDSWQTKRSLSVELRLWADDGSFDGLYPLSTGQALNDGRRSFSSSKTLSAMLRRAVKNAVAGLPEKGGR